MNLISRRAVRWLALSAVGLSLATMVAAFLFVAANMHDGSAWLLGKVVEWSFLWPLTLCKLLGLAGPPAFALWMTLTFTGYFVFYGVVLTVIYWVDTFFARRVDRAWQSRPGR